MPITTTKAISIPVWVRVPGIITLVLVGVLLSTMLLGAADEAGIDGSHRPGSEAETTDHGSRSETDRGGHGPNDEMDVMDHSGIDSE